jgi:N-acetylglucosaminyldiphosphoundecaprenol N-acetyl-beta-D-mannosaminyltransferase
MTSDPDRIHLLGCDFDVVDLEAALQRVGDYIDSGTFHCSSGVNVDHLVRMRRDPAFRALIRDADLVTADGTPVVWASRLLGCPLPDRVPSIDLFEALLGVAAERGWRVFLLGACEDVLDEATELFRCRHPDLNIVGRHHGYYADEAERSVAEQVQRACPDLLFVAMSSPRKERFVHGHRELLENVPFVLGVGGAFDIAAGRTRRAPRWMARAGVEWLYRFAQEPKRLARRYFVRDMTFFWMLLEEAARRATQRGSSRERRPQRRVR